MRCIHLISGPRNISTALMYSFRQRSDTSVIDEPFYAHFLAKTGAKHPGREMVLQSQSENPDTVWKQLLQYPAQKPLLFIKDMGNHFVTPPEAARNISTYLFLIRHPALVIHSYSKVIPVMDIRDIGIKDQWDIFGQLKHAGLPVVVMDSSWMLEDPESRMAQLCEALNITFEPEMLHWPAGPKPEDGCWATYWYTNTHKSSRFTRGNREIPDLDPGHHALLEEALVYYHQLGKVALQ